MKPVLPMNVPGSPMYASYRNMQKREGNYTPDCYSVMKQLEVAVKDKKYLDNKIEQVKKYCNQKQFSKIQPLEQSPTLRRRLMWNMFKQRPFFFVMDAACGQL